MDQMRTEQQICVRYSEVLSYPGTTLFARLRELADTLAAANGDAAEEVEKFILLSEGMPTDLLEEHYTRAFDLAPQAPPYLSIYLFGAENPQRGQFMAGLNGAYADTGHDCGGELPDHLPLVLGYAAVAPQEEWEELRETCLPAPLKHMVIALEKAGNPYRHLLASLKSYLRSLKYGELSHA